MTYDNKGHWLYDPKHKDSITLHFGAERFSEHKWGIIELRVEGRLDPVLLFPSEVTVSSGDGHSTRLSFEDIVAPDLPEARRPIVFYLEGMDNNLRRGANNLKPGATQLIVALRNLGYPIIFTNSLSSLEATVRKQMPSIVLVSATQDHMPFAVKAYGITKGIDQNIIVGLGGPGAIPEGAGLFDFVGIGEFYLGLPRLLHELIVMISAGEIKDSQATPWKEIIEKLTGSTETREQAVADLGDATDYSPVFDGLAATRLLNISARRYFSVDEQRWSVDFPINVDPVVGAKLFIRTDEGIIAPNAIPLPIELTALANPMLLGPEEFDPLSGAHYPSMADGNTGFPFLYPSIYAQHGCKVEPAKDRCNFCSIQGPANGRSPSIDQIIKVMETSVVMGQERFSFVDDRFVQSARWIKEWAAKVIDLGLHEALSIRVQTRVDGISDELMNLLRVEVRAAYAMGIETASPKRAENENGLRKVGKGRGQKYYDDIRHTLERLAKNPVSGDEFYIISVSPGDKIADIAEDVYNQLSVIAEFWSKYSYFTRFNYNVKQAPYYGDRVTPGLAGLERAQPTHILPGLSAEDITVGQITGQFIPFGVDLVDRALRTFGVFIPKDFVWPAVLKDFIDATTSKRSMTLESILSAAPPETLNVGDMVRALEYVYDNSKNLTEEERVDLREWLDKIVPLYEQLKRSIGERVMSKKERREQEKARRDSYGIIPGSTIN